MNEDRRPLAFIPEPAVAPPPFCDRAGGRFLCLLLGVALLAGLLGGVSWAMVRLRTPAPPPGEVVIAARDLRPYQSVQAGDVVLEQIPHAVAGTPLTDTASLVSQAIVLKPVRAGQALTAESVVLMPPTVDLAGTVALEVPFSGESVTAAALEPGAHVWVIGIVISETTTAQVYSVHVPLIQVRAGKAIVAVPPDVAAQLSIYLPARGQLIVASGTDR